jgi:hypothetical protein
MQTLFTYLRKQAILIRRSTVLSLSPQIVFPAKKQWVGFPLITYTHKQGFEQDQACHPKLIPL